MKNYYIYLSVFLFSILGMNAQTLNEVMGTGSGVNITTGDFNTFYGDSSGAFLTTGSRTVLLGYSAGRSMTTQSELIAIGYLAGYSNASGFDNTYVGYEAGRLTTIGGDNTFIGAESGEMNTTGYDNTFVGEESGANNTTGYENTFIGEDAGFSNTTGYKQTFIGNEVGISSDVGYRNTGVGSESMSDVDEGHHNTGLGDSAAIDIGDGIYNTMVGAAAGVATEYADYNTFIGAQAGWDNNRTNNTTNANHNTYLGFSAGFTNREGQYNVGIGSLADFDNNNRSNAIFMGYDINASNNNVIGVGNRAFVDGQYAISLGHDHDTRGDYSVMLGYLGNMSALADYSVGIGDRVDIEENDAVGIGRNVDIDNQFAIAIGSTTVAQNDGAIVIGFQASSTDVAATLPTNNIAIGVNANVQGLNSVAIGNAAAAINDNTMVLGGSTNPLSVGIGTDSPNANASLDLADTDKGLLVNRLTNALRTTLEGSLGVTDEGLMVFDTEDDALYVWDGAAWAAFTTGSSGSDDQTLTLNVNSLELENGGTVDLTPFMDNTDAQALTLNVNSLELVDGGTVDLTPFMDNTDTQNISGSGLAGAILTIGIENGSSEAIDLSSIVDSGTDDQQLSLAGNSLNLEDGGVADLSPFMDNTDAQNISGSNLAGTLLTIGIVGGSSEAVDLSSIVDSGTDDQQLSLAGNNLNLEDGGVADLTPFMDNTDTQNITGSGLAGSTLTIGIENGASQAVDLSSLSDSGTDDQQLSLAGNNLSLEDGGVADLSPFLDNTDTQNITGSGLVGSTLTIGIENGASQAVDLSSLSDSGTDDQQLSLAGNNLNLEDGGVADLTPFMDNTDAQNISGSGLAGNILTIGIEGGSSEAVDLSSLIGSGTDNQNMSGSNLTGDILTVGIENGTSETIDLSSLNNTGTDDQNLANFILSAGSLLSLSIQDGNAVSVNLAPLLEDLTDVVSDLQAVNANQQSQIDDLILRIEIREECACDPTLGVGDNTLQTDRAYLLQNIPNPFDNTTSVGYFVPFTHSKANIVISTMAGQIVDNISVSRLGVGSISVNKSQMATATYLYTLYVDGKRIDTKRMIVE